MFIYLLKRPDSLCDHDEACGMVVVAADATTARRFAADESGDEGPDVWRDRKKVTARRVGIADNVKAGVLLRDFLNG